MKIFIKRFSIFFLAIMVSTNLIINTQREAKAIVPAVIVAPVVAEGLTTISLALLMYADYKFTDNTKAYAKAKELDQKLIDMGVSLVDGALTISQNIYDAIAEVIANTKANLIANTIIRKPFSGTYSTTFSPPIKTDYVTRDSVYFNCTPNMQGDISFNFDIIQGNTHNYSVPFTFTTSPTTVSLNLLTRFRNSWSGVNVLWVINEYDVAGALVATNQTLYNLSPTIATGDLTFDGDYNIGALTGSTDRSISLDYTPDVESADTEKAKVALPIGASVSAIPNAWTTPLSEDLSIPVPTVGDIATVNVGELPTTGDVVIDIPGTIGAIEDKFDKPNFDKTWKIIKDMDTSRGVPPKVTFDLSKLYSAATSRFGAPRNPFESKEYTLIDFAMLQSYQFGGLPLIDYFRGIVGMGFIITTFMYVWRKITPNNVIGG